ncbi:MAG: hypothetical protein FJ214_11100 [Ignavibacteria bacterium]|nr:hypothetical protein [Ignavibacteria bacterium]
MRCNDSSHPIVKGIDWSTIPALLGFNETKIHKDATSLIDIRNGDSWYPLFALREFGKGLVTCWMSGASPHWGINFMKWKEYKKFWQQVFLYAK